MKLFHIRGLILIVALLLSAACNGAPAADVNVEQSAENSNAIEAVAESLSDDATAVESTGQSAESDTNAPQPTPTNTTLPTATPQPAPTATQLPPTATAVPPTATLEPTATALPTATAEPTALPVAINHNTIILLDASGSMLNPLGDGTRLSVAKKAVGNLSAALPSSMNASLWAYGHRVDQADKPASCLDIEALIPLGSVDAEQFERSAAQLNAKGWTPITTSLMQAAASMPIGDSERNTIVLVSDGEETCDGDPCALAAELAASDAQITIHAIGLAVDDVTRAQLQCIADAANGTYSDADSAESLQDALTGAAAAADEAFSVFDAAGIPLVVRVGPDGRHVYWLSDDAELITFARDADSGRVSYVGRVTNNEDGFTSMRNPFDMVISPDGRHIYVSGDEFGQPRIGSITVFARDAESGMVTFVQTAQPFKPWVGNQSNSVKGITISPDGAHVYALHSGGSREHSVAVLQRDAASGELVAVQLLSSVDDGADGIAEPLDIIVSPDGATAYISGWVNVLGVFARDPASGALSQIQRIDTRAELPERVLGIMEMAISADGQHLYAASGRGTGSISIFKRAADGTLALHAQLERHVGDTLPDERDRFNLDGPRTFVLSPNNAAAYVGAFQTSMLTVLGRDSATGDLALVQAIKDDENGVDGLQEPLSIALSPDGRHIYVGAFRDTSLSVFARDLTTNQLTFVEIVRTERE